MGGVRTTPIVALLVAACSATPPSNLPPITTTEWPAPKTLAASLDGPQAAITAQVVVRHPSTHADVMGGLPWAITGDRPIAGRPWSLTWLSQPVEPRSTPVVALLASERDVDPAPIPRGRGAQLQVAPDHVIGTGAVLSTLNGITTLSMTWPTTAVGSRWMLQLLIADSRTEAGLVVAPMVEVLVGNR